MKALAQAQEKRRKAEEAERIIASVAEAMEGLPEPRTVVPISLWGSELSISWILPSVSELLQLIEALPPMAPMSRSSGTFSALKPSALLRSDESEELIEPITIDLENGKRGYPFFETGAKFRWMTTVSSRVVFVTVSIRGENVSNRWPRIDVSYEGSKLNPRAVSRLYNGLFGGNSIKWASGAPEFPSDFSLYFRREEGQDPLEFPSMLRFIKCLSD